MDGEEYLNIKVLANSGWWEPGTIC